MPIGINPVGNGHQDLLTAARGSSKNFVTVTDAAGIPVTAPTPIEPSPSTSTTSAVASLSSVTDATASALQSLSALSSSVSQFSTTGATSSSSEPYLAPVGGEMPKAGTDATVADFGSITINGVSTVIGSVQAPYMSTQEASSFVANAINANTKNTVEAAVDQSGFLQLTAKDGTSAINIAAVGGSTTGISTQQTAIGFQTGTFGSSITASSKIDGPFFEENFASTYAAASAGGSSSSTAPAPAPAPAPTPAPSPAPAPGSPPTEQINKGQAKKQGIDTTAEAPTAPQTTTTGGGVQLTPAPTASSNLGTQVNGGGQSPHGNAYGLIEQVAQVQAAQKGGQSAADIVNQQSAQQILQSLPEPPALLEDPDDTSWAAPIGATASIAAASSGTAQAGGLSGASQGAAGAAAGASALPGQSSTAGGAQSAPGLGGGAPPGQSKKDDD